MFEKAPILPHRVRTTPKSFGFVDHRLVRDRHIEKCSHAASTLYLFLVCVGDRQGLSYYGDKAVMKILGMDGETLRAARRSLLENGLVAFRDPLYQVLSLEPVRNRGNGQEMRLADILRLAGEVRHD